METLLNIIRAIVPSAFLRAQVLATARHLATWASGLIIGWLVLHHASTDDANKIADGVSAIILGLASYGFSLWDVSSVHEKIKDATITAGVNTAAAVKADPKVATQIKLTAQSGTPEALHQLISSLGS